MDRRPAPDHRHQPAARHHRVHRAGARLHKGPYDVARRAWEAEAEVDALAPGARIAWRDDARWAPHGGESRVDVAARSMPLVAELVAHQTEWGADESDRPVVLVAHGGLIAALTAALLDIPVDNWPILGGMGNASWVQLSGHSPTIAPPFGFADIKWRLDVWNASAQVANDVL